MESNKKFKEDIGEIMEAHLLEQKKDRIEDTARAVLPALITDLSHHVVTGEKWSTKEVIGMAFNIAEEFEEERAKRHDVEE